MFAKCAYATEVRVLLWSKMKIDCRQEGWRELLQWGMKIGTGKTTLSCKKRAMFAAYVYCLWQERNQRLFNLGSQSVQNIVGKIWHIITCKFESGKDM